MKIIAPQPRKLGAKLTLSLAAGAVIGVTLLIVSLRGNTNTTQAHADPNPAPATITIPTTTPEPLKAATPALTPIIKPPPEPPIVAERPIPPSPARPELPKPGPAQPTTLHPRGEIDKPVDLLKLITVSKDTAYGPWRMRNNNLEYAAPMQYGALKTRYQPGEQYDFRAVFTRISGDDDIGFHIVSGNRRALLSLCGWHNTVAGFHGINGKDADSDANPTKTKSSIENNKEYMAIVQVRKYSIRILLNDKELINYRFETPNFTGVEGVPQSKSEPMLGVYCSSCTAKFSVLEVTERAPDPADVKRNRAPPKEPQEY